jgi:phytoene dehydrogenase-like protein
MAKKQKKHDVIVIGGGVAGLGCAALMAKRGLRVLVLEKNARPGGRTLTHVKNGFKYEVGAVGVSPFYGHNLDVLFRKLEIGPDAGLVGPQPTRMLYRGRSGKWRKLDVPLPARGQLPDPSGHFEIWELDAKEQEQAIAVLSDLWLMEEARIAAVEAENISFNEFLSRYEVPKPVYHFFAFLANGMMVLPIEMISASEYIKTFKDVMVSQGGAYPRGGFGRLVDDIVGALKANGGELWTGAKVKKITVEGGKVTGLVTEDGEEIKCPIVVSSAGIQPTVLKLVGEKHFDRSYVNWVKDLVPTWGWTGQVYMLSKPVFDCYQMAIYNDNNYWNMERYLKIAGGKPPDDLWVYVLVTSNYDPSLAPPGKQLINVGTNCLPDPTNTKMTKYLWKKTHEILCQHYPEIETVIENIEYAGPADICALARDSVVPGQGGEWGGLALIKGQSGPQRPSIKAPIRGLFYVGLDAGGAAMGLQGSTLSAMKAADEVFEYRTLRPATMW